MHELDVFHSIPDTTTLTPVQLDNLFVDLINLVLKHFMWPTLDQIMGRAPNWEGDGWHYDYGLVQYYPEQLHWPTPKDANADKKQFFVCIYTPPYKADGVFEYYYRGKVSYMHPPKNIKNIYPDDYKKILEKFGV